MPAKSIKQQRFFGMVRALQKGEMENPSPEVAIASSMSKPDVKKFAKTKHKGLPMKKESVFAGNYEGPLYAPHPDLKERADTWHPDPEKDRKLGGPGANQRAREDRAAAAKKSSSGQKSDPKTSQGRILYGLC